MFSPKSILVPVDLYSESHTALRYTAALSRHYRARVILHNVQDAELPPNLMTLPERLISGHDAEWLRELKRQMTTRCSDELLKGLMVEAGFSGGVPHEEILRAAHQRGSDLIVMEATARPRPRREVLGSTAEAVVASSDLPVLVVRPVQHGFVFQTPAGGQIALGRILLATEFEESDQRARSLAIDLTRQFSSRLSVLTVMERVGLLRALLPGSAAKYEETFRENAESAFRAMESQAAGLVVEKVIREGSVYQEVVRHAMERETDLIVLGTVRKGPGLLGSNAERIVRLAPCPTLLVS